MCSEVEKVIGPVARMVRSEIEGRRFAGIRVVDIARQLVEDEEEEVDRSLKRAMGGLAVVMRAGEWRDEGRKTM